MLLPSFFIVLLASSPDAISDAPNPAPGISIPITKRTPKFKTTADMRSHMQQQAERLISKYSANPSASLKKRASTASVQMEDVEIDRYYTVLMSIGTPAQNFQVQLDTSSSDLWLALGKCGFGPVCESRAPSYDPTKSSSYGNNKTPYSIGNGQEGVLGSTANETVSVSGFTVHNQTLGLVTNLNQTAIPKSVFGVMGLARPPAGNITANPWWINVVSSGQWSNPMFAFHFARVKQDSAKVDVLPNNTSVDVQGGSFDLGFANPKYYTGDINYINPTRETTWTIPLQDVTMNGKSLNLSGEAIIDTGMSNIGCPTNALATLYAAIPNAAPCDANEMTNIYCYRCSEADGLTVSLTFGGRAYPINATDLTQNLDTEGQQCYGSIIGRDSPSGEPAWIIGEAFLKNVYSVFRYNPPAVGFATLVGGNSSSPSPQSISSGMSMSTSTGSGASFSTASVSFYSPPMSGGSPTTSGSPQPTRSGALPKGRLSGATAVSVVISGVVAIAADLFTGVLG